MRRMMNSYLDIDEKNLHSLLGRVVSICDLEYSGKPVPRAQGSFVPLHFLSLFLKQSHPCCFLSFSEAYIHSKIITTKCGFSLQNYVSSGLLRYYSAHDPDFTSVSTIRMMETKSCTGTECTGQPSPMHLLGEHPAPLLHTVFRAISLVIAEMRAKYPDRPPCIVIEDLSLILDLGCELKTVIAFVHSLHSLVEDGCLVLYTSASEDLETDVELRNFLFHYAEWNLETYGLRSGLSSALDGELRIYVRKPGSLCETNKILQYKVQERRIQFFAPGTSHGTL
ncbi:elongator complex protein 6-like [Paramacrobiotus metropolitanus]|uniref:elongator complex protein 6-like n=1 Tax=Paramacrobiotus metropolitanus TaxID=2943436 RepID=UPI0024464F1F|nr:elongator complex protein 6-like [Paramacrobiotus metropolitanus]